MEPNPAMDPVPDTINALKSVADAQGALHAGDMAASLNSLSQAKTAIVSAIGKIETAMAAGPTPSGPTP